MKGLNTGPEREATRSCCALHPGAAPRSSRGDRGMELQARMFPAESIPPRADKQVALRVFNFLHHRAAVCLSYWEPLNALGSSSKAFCGRREVTELSWNPLWQAKFSLCSSSLTRRGLHLSIPPTPPSRGAELLPVLSCGFSLMEHSGLRSTNKAKVKASPCTRQTQRSGSRACSGSCRRGSRRLLPHSAHGQKGSTELFLAPTLQNKKQLQAIVCFLSIFSPPCLFSPIFPPGARAAGLFQEEGAPFLGAAWGHCSHHPGAVAGALRDHGHRAAERGCFSLQSTVEEGGVSHSEENPPPFLLCLRRSRRWELR